VRSQPALRRRMTYSGSYPESFHSACHKRSAGSEIPSSSALSCINVIDPAASGAAGGSFTGSSVQSAFCTPVSHLFSHCFLVQNWRDSQAGEQPDDSASTKAACTTMGDLRILSSVGWVGAFMRWEFLSDLQFHQKVFAAIATLVTIGSGVITIVWHRSVERPRG
jgi:hypothetical protein